MVLGGGDGEVGGVGGTVGTGGFVGVASRVGVQSVHSPQRNLVGAGVAKTVIQNPSQRGAIGGTEDFFRVRHYGGVGVVWCGYMKQQKG